MTSETITEPGHPAPQAARGRGVPLGALPMSVDRLRTWVRQAQRGARLTYGRGGVMRDACSEAVRQEVWNLAQQGYLSPHRCKDPATGEVLQIVMRGSRPAPRGMGGL